MSTDIKDIRRRALVSGLTATLSAQLSAAIEQLKFATESVTRVKPSVGYTGAYLNKAVAAIEVARLLLAEIDNESQEVK